MQFGIHTPPWSQLYLPVHEHYRLITSSRALHSAESQLGCYICDFQKRSGSQQRAMALQGGLFVANGVATEMLAFSRSSDCPCHLLRMWKVFCCHCHVNSHFWGSQCLETLMAKEKRGGENNQVMLVRQYCLLRLRTSSGQ